MSTVFTLDVDNSRSNPGTLRSVVSLRVRMSVVECS